MYDDKLTADSVSGKCPNCGYTLHFDPQSQNLVCDSCGSIIPLKKEETIEEFDFETYLKKYKENQDSLIHNGQNIHIRCEDCGALIVMEKNQIATECPFCGSNKTIKQNIEDEIIHIEGVVPFKISLEENNQLFYKWIKSRFWAPKKIKKDYFHPSYHAVYIPIWTYDANTNSRYTAMRGTYYYVTRTIRSGNQTRIVQERRIRWTPVSGSSSRFFDDIVIRGTKNILDKYIDQVAQYNLNEAVKYDEKFLLGYQAERPSINLEEGFYQAKNRMNNVIRNQIICEIGGDTVSSLNIQTKYEDVTFKQLLCPLYNGSYQTLNKKYHFVINGQTGKFQGDYPKSPTKITLFVLFILLIIIGMILLIYFL